TALFTFLSEVFVPRAHMRQDDRRHKTTTARNLLEQSALAREEQRYRDAYNHLLEYLVIDPENTVQLLEADKLMDRIIEDRRETNLEPEELIEEPSPIKPAMTAEEYVEAARSSFDKGDYLSAHYYASIAFQIDPLRQEADELARRAWRKVNELQPSTYEMERYRLHEQKKKGIQALLADRSLEAYYLFAGLKEEYPLDPDVNIYLEESRKAVGNISFFLDEMERMSSVPGVRQIMFRNTPAEEDRELVYIDTYIPAKEGFYLFNVEVLSFTEGGKILFHYTAPYGKIINGRLVTLAVDREDKSEYYEAVYITGSRPEAERNILPLHLSPEMITHCSIRQDFLATASLPELFNLAKVFDSFGLKKEPVEREMLFRILRPFTLLVFGFFTLALSWSLRPTKNRPGVLAYLFVFLLPLVFHILLSLYYYGAELFYGFFLLLAGPTITLAMLILLQGLLLVAAFLYLAGQTTDYEA
ncbi:MAG: hypothetical protein JW760_08990, partial [Spirochaetales bacterium]|nr:hypothetical protein [Spirochaetales bacterium]